MAKEQIDYKAVQNEAQSVLRQASQALDRLQDVVSSSSREAYRQVSDTATDIFRGIDTRRSAKFIRRHPVQVTLAAVGIGFLLGALLTRSSSED